MDIYDTIVQLKSIELMKRPSSFLWDTFVQDGGAVSEDEAVWDFRKGAKKMAPFVHENTGGVLMERTGYETDNVIFPTIAPERMVEKKNIAKRAFNEAIYGTKTPQQRAKELVATDLAYLKDSIQLRREWMAARVLLTGKLDILEYTNEGRTVRAAKIADYSFDNVYTPSTPWSDASADPSYDMEAMLDMVQEGQGKVDIIVMAPDVKRALTNHEGFLKKLDLKNGNFGQVSTSYREDGLRYIGTNSDGVDMYAFAGKYLNDKGAEEAYLPSGTVIAASQGILKCLHGPITQLEGKDFKTYIAREVPKRYASEKSDSIMQRVTSRPMIVPFNVSAWAVGSVL